MKSKEHGYEIITSNRRYWIVRVYSGKLAFEHKFSRRSSTFRDVCEWIFDHGAVIFTGALPDTDAMALEMSADCDMQDRAMLSAVGVYVLQRAARLGYERVKYEQLREAVTSYVTGDAIRRAMDVGVKLGIYVKVGPDAWRLKRDNQLGRRVDHDPLFPGAGA